MWLFLSTHVLAPAAVAFFVSMVLGSISEGSKRRQEFKLHVADRARKSVKAAREVGAKFRLLRKGQGQLATAWAMHRDEILGLQAELVSEVRTLEALGFKSTELLDNFCVALTGGAFDGGVPDHKAALAITNSAADLAAGISYFEVAVVKRRILGSLSDFLFPET